jgi:hypothetical protein
MISSDDVERALDWLVANANKAAQARANRVYLEQFIRVVRAERQVQEQQAGASAAAAEAVALASDAYKQTLLAYKESVEADERMRFLCAAAEAKIEAWRSLEATRRAQERVG